MLNFCDFIHVYVFTTNHHLNFLEAHRTKIVEFANSVDPDEAAHIEPLHLDIHCLLIFVAWTNLFYLFIYFLQFCSHKFCRL